MPFTALHRLLGKDAGPVTDALLDEAVAAKLAETDDLDWKSELPPTSKVSSTDFPKDVAAMANSGGGTIVYGVTEDEKRATGRADVGELTENHERALRAAAYNAVVPPVFGLHITALGEEGRRAVVVVVPASTDGPHLIYNNQFFGAPLRNDADTAWMKERQIEAAYRARLEGQRRAVTELNELWQGVSDSLPEEGRARVVVVARPRSPIQNAARPSRELAAEWLQASYLLARGFTNSNVVSATHPLSAVSTFNPRPGLRRWVAPPTNPEGPRARAASAEIHHDGAVAIAAVVGGQRSGAESTHPNHVVEARHLEAAIADLMALARVVGSACGVSEYDVQLGITWVGEPLKLLTVEARSNYPFDPGVPLHRYVPVKRTVRVDVSDADFHHEVHDLAEDALNQGGINFVRSIMPADRDTTE